MSELPRCRQPSAQIHVLGCAMPGYKNLHRGPAGYLKRESVVRQPGAEQIGIERASEHPALATRQTALRPHSVWCHFTYESTDWPRVECEIGTVIGSSAMIRGVHRLEAAVGGDPWQIGQWRRKSPARRWNVEGPVQRMFKDDAMQSAPGKPTGLMQSTRETRSPNEGYRLYSRRCERGIVYLNLTGKQKTVTLPEDGTYYNRSGSRVRTMTLEDMTGDYVLTQPPSF